MNAPLVIRPFTVFDLVLKKRGSCRQLAASTCVSAECVNLADSEFGFDARASCLSRRAVIDDEAPLYDPSARGAELSESAFIEHERARSARIVRRSTRLEHR